MNMITYLDTAPLENTKYIVTVIDQTDNTLSVIGTDDEGDLKYRGLDNIGGIPVGNTVYTTDCDGCKCKITRLQ